MTGFRCWENSNVGTNIVRQTDVQTYRLAVCHTHTDRQTHKNYRELLWERQRQKFQLVWKEAWIPVVASFEWQCRSVYLLSCLEGPTLLANNLMQLGWTAIQSINQCKQALHSNSFQSHWCNDLPWNHMAINLGWCNWVGNWILLSSDSSSLL